jgi:hypothetical protein
MRSGAGGRLSTRLALRLYRNASWTACPDRVMPHSALRRAATASSHCRHVTLGCPRAFSGLSFGIDGDKIRFGTPIHRLAARGEPKRSCVRSGGHVYVWRHAGPLRRRAWHADAVQDVCHGLWPRIRRLFSVAPCALRWFAQAVSGPSQEPRGVCGWHAVDVDLGQASSFGHR